MKNKKNCKKHNDYLFWIKFLKNHKFSIVNYIVIRVIAMIISVLIPVITSKFVDAIINAKKNEFIKYIIYFVILLIVNIVFNYILNIMYTKIFNNIVFGVKKDIYYRFLNTKDIKNVINYNSGYLVSRIDTDVNTVYNYIFGTCINVLLQIVNSLIIVIILLRVSSSITIIIIVLLVLNSYIYIPFRKKLYIRNKILKETSNKMFSQYIENIDKLKSIKINGWGDIFAKKFEMKYNDFYDGNIKYAKTQTIYSSSNKIIQYIINTGLTI